jgi:hypothetical protein
MRRILVVDDDMHTRRMGHVKHSAAGAKGLVA